jgi:uncharacterized protein YegL
MDIEKLKNRDYYILLDKSGSMEESDTPSGVSRFKYAEESTIAIARKLGEYDPDGISLIPFASSYKAYDNVTHSAVQNVFKENTPMGGTNLAPPLQWCMDDYLAKKAKNQQKANGAIVLVITDGCPSDEALVAKAIVNFTKKLDNGDSEFGISFVQVGKDSHASAYLKRLDDNLTSEGAKFDIVDTKTMDEVESVGLTETLIAALTD